MQGSSILCRDMQAARVEGVPRLSMRPSKDPYGSFLK